MQRSYFPPPAAGFAPGGAHLAVYLVPVFEGRLVTFEVTAPEARGRWLPWNILAFRGNPYEEAAALADDWCQGAVADLRVVDVLPGRESGGSWELAIVFRAELTAPPSGDADRRPVLLAAGRVEPAGPFDRVDLERWLASLPPIPQPPADESRPRLIF